MTGLCRNTALVSSGRHLYAMLSLARQDLSNGSYRAVFLSNSGGARAAYRSAALNLHIGSLYEWSVALVEVRCESSQSCRSAVGDRPLPPYSPSHCWIRLPLGRCYGSC